MSAIGSYFQQAPEAIAVIDPDTLQIIEANSRLADSLGYTPKELLNLKLVDILNQKPEEIRNQLFQIIQQDGVVRQNWPFLKKDGSTADPGDYGVQVPLWR